MRSFKTLLITIILYTSSIAAGCPGTFVIDPPILYALKNREIQEITREQLCPGSLIFLLSQLNQNGIQ